MSLTPAVSTAAPLAVEIRKTPRRRIGIVVALLLLAGGGMLGAKVWESGWRPSSLWKVKAPSLALNSADQGDLAVYVVETGTLESANNTTVKCQVEALMGTVGGTASMGRSGTGGAAGAMAGGAAAGGGSAASKSAAGAATAARRGGSAAKSVGGGAASRGTAKGSAAATSGGGGGGGTGAAAGSGGGGGGAGTTVSASSPMTRPMIRSFSYVVAPHVSLRTSGGGARAASSAVASSGGVGGVGGRVMTGGGGGGGRGGSGGGGGGSRSGGSRGGGGGGFGMDEKPGSTRIIEIKPEGMVVKAGEVVCRLDSAAFRDELQSQMIKVEQAKSWVEQAASILAVNEITFREYRDGIYPQDLMLVRQYLTACTLEAERAQKNVEWSKETLDKGYRASAQYKADLLALQRAELALREAKRMEERLVKYTGPKILKSLEAKLESIRADKLAQESAYQLEMDRKRRLERMIANCTLAAPREGIVVYSNQSNMWGRSTARIEEGATVREGQPIFDLPDPKHMRLKARINESKLSFIRTGQKALVRVEAFPDRPLTATVAEITPIPAPTNVMSDTRVYFAIVNIDDSSQLDLRPGLTAEISFYFDTHKNVTRLPIESVRWVDRKAYVAVPTQNAEDAKSPRWSWKPIKVGLANATHIEILEGLAAGDKVIADPAALPAPRPSDLRQTAGAGTSAAKG